MGLVSLGDITFTSFEVPSRIEFGGKQKLIVHKLIGGMRVIDALGRDDAVLRWRGILSGADASARARVLDSMRAAGSLQILTWDVFCYAVVISELKMSFSNPWWIPYDIMCSVQQDLTEDFVVYTPTITNSVIGDVTEVSQLIGSLVEIDTAQINTLLSSGPDGQRQLIALTTVLQRSVLQGIADAEVGFSSSDVGQLTSSAGSLAQLCCAQGYLDRSMTNINNIGF